MSSHAPLTPRGSETIRATKRKTFSGPAAGSGASFLLGGLAAGLLLLFAAGCSEARHITATLGSSSKPYQEFLEDPVNLTTIKTIAVFPFDNRAPKPGFDADDFANKLANKLAAHGKVRVLYPRDILAAVEQENREARHWNAQLREKAALGLHIPERETEGSAFAAEPPRDRRPRPYYNPIKNIDEAVRLARRAKADAIIVGEISDFDPYMRPRLSLTMRLIATGSTETSAQAIAEMTQWGVPRMGPGASGGGVVYIRQQSFDSSIGSVGLDVSRYGRTHLIDHNPYDTEVFVRSMSHYYDVVASQLAGAYAEARRKAVKEAEDRAKAQARAKNEDQNRAMARLTALMERDARIPDYETDSRQEAYFDQAFVNNRAMLDANGGDRRIMSWRADGRNIRSAPTAERWGRDMMIPENERGKGLEGNRSVMDSSFPDADAMMERNMGNRDRSWRPDYYNHANPQKSASLYDPGEFRGGGGD